MAPEARAGARGGRGRGAGRGRGRGGRGGRGASAAAASNGVPNADTGDAPASQPLNNTTSDTPAATASSSSRPDPTPSAGTAATTRNTAARPTQARASASGTSKFLPRAIRRSQVDREAIAQKETQKQEDRAAQDARMKRAGRGRGARRARGGAPGGFQDRVIRGGNGGFGSAIEVTGSRSSSSGFGRLYDYGSGGGSAGGASGSAAWSGGVKSEGGPSKDFSSESSRPTGKRMNTDKIVEYITIEDDDEVKAKEGTPMLLPKGMQREEHKETVKAEVATTEEVEAADRGDAPVTETVPVPSGASSEDDDIFFNPDADADVEMKDDDRKWPGAKEGRRVKIEGEEVTEIDTLTTRRAMKLEQMAAEKKAAEKKAAEKKKQGYKDPEDQLAAETMAFQRRLFGIPSDDDSDSDLQETRTPRKPAIVDGNLYLFQFPPIMPPLYIAQRTQKSRNPVKDEPNDDVVMLDVPANDPNKTIDLSGDDAIVKQEDGARADIAAKEPEEQPEGFVGRLIVRKSGKMQIDYGGMLFDCESGIPVSFLRTAVLTEMDDEKKPDGYAGTAYGMGQITGKFVAVPKWSEEEDWVVDPDELPPNGIGAAEDMMAE